MCRVFVSRVAVPGEKSLTRTLPILRSWETNPNRGTTGVFTPPQISKMREEVRTIQHNKNERSVIKKNAQKKLDLNIAAYQQFQLEIGRVITSAHRRQLLEQEEKIHLLHMEKKDVSGEKDLLQRETEHQAEKIAQLEALLKEQSLLLKGKRPRGLVSLLLPSSAILFLIFFCRII